MSRVHLKLKFLRLSRLGRERKIRGASIQAHPRPHPLQQRPQQALAHAIRFLSIDAIVRAQEGHQGVPLGMAEIATALYTRHLKFNPQDAAWFDRDRVVLSNGHGSMLMYSLLHLTGYPQFPIEEIQRFRELDSVCEGHLERPHGPANGIEVTTGPLGQGIANAFGMAVAEAYLNARFGSGLVDHRTYAFVGDGCLQEGIGQEMIPWPATCDWASWCCCGTTTASPTTAVPSCPSAKT